VCRTTARGPHMTDKKSYNFTPARDYGGDWHAYFADYREHVTAINNPQEAEVKEGKVETTKPVEKLTIEEALKASKQFATYAQDLGFEVDVWVGGQRKFWRGEWQEVAVWHVAGKKGKSAFHMRWHESDGAMKAQECKVQVNGGSVEWLSVTAAKKRLLEAE